jgi:hypothetical protein
MPKSSKFSRLSVFAEFKFIDRQNAEIVIAAISTFTIDNMAGR